MDVRQLLCLVEFKVCYLRLSCLLLFTDGYHGREAPVAADAAAIGCRPATDLLHSKLDLHIADDDDVMSCSDDLQTDSSQNINDSDEHRTSGQCADYSLDLRIDYNTVYS